MSQLSVLFQPFSLASVIRTSVFPQSPHVSCISPRAVQFEGEGVGVGLQVAVLRLDEEGLVSGRLTDLQVLRARAEHGSVVVDV